MEEIWKNVVGYEKYYQVSNFGNIKSLDRQVRVWHGYITKKGKILSPSIGSCGYYVIGLNANNKPKTCLVHRLVAQAFIPNPQNLECVNHKDENKLNNNVNNLEWCTKKYNINYGTCIKRRNETSRNNCKLSKVTLQYTLNGEFIKEWKSTMDIERTLGLSNKSISACCIGKQKTAYGFIWKYR